MAIHCEMEPIICEIERLEHVLSMARDALKTLPEALGSAAGVDYLDHVRPIVTSHYMIGKAVEDLQGVAQRLMDLRARQRRLETLLVSLTSIADGFAGAAGSGCATLPPSQG